MQLITASNQQDYKLQKAKIMNEREVLISTLFKIMEDSAAGDDLCDLCPKTRKCEGRKIKECLRTVAQNL